MFYNWSLQIRLIFVLYLCMWVHILFRLWRRRMFQVEKNYSSWQRIVLARYLDSFLFNHIRDSPIARTRSFALVVLEASPQVYILQIYWRGGVWKKTGTLAKFGQKTGTFTHFGPIFACFLHTFLYIFTYLQIFWQKVIGQDIRVVWVKNRYIWRIYTCELHFYVFETSLFRTSIQWFLLVIQIY